MYRTNKVPSLSLSPPPSLSLSLSPPSLPPSLSLMLLQSSGKPAVIFATEEGHPDCLRLLALAGADLNASFGDSELNSLHRYYTLQTNAYN